MFLFVFNMGMAVKVIICYNINIKWKKLTKIPVCLPINILNIHNLDRDGKFNVIYNDN